MEVKTEESLVICRFCLSTNRRTTYVHTVAYAFGLMTDWESTASVRVCFECRAFLAKVLRFQVQAIEAKHLLEAAANRSFPLHCLSTLSSTTKTSFDECYYCDTELTTCVELTPDVAVKSDEDTDFEVFVEPAGIEFEGSNTIDTFVTNNLQVKLEKDIPEVKVEKSLKKEVKKTKIKEDKTSSRKERTKEKKQRKVKKKLETKEETHKDITRLKHVKQAQYECDICGKIFKRRILIYKHMDTHFISTKSFLCETCGKYCKSHNSLIVHSLTHAPIDARPYACNVCNRKFITKDKLRNHMLFHDGVKKFQCDLCDRRFWLEPDVKRHKKLRHGLADIVKKTKFTRTKSLYKNQRLYVDEATGLPKEEHPNKGRRKLKNPDSSTHLDGSNRLAGSTRYPSASEHQCNICGKKFKLKSSLDFHAVVHTGERPFKCDECGLTFKFNSGLWGHKITHTGVKAHQCSICGASFSLKGNLNGHMKMHTNNKPYECDICGQRFPWRRNLRNHLRVHSK